MGCDGKFRDYLDFWREILVILGQSSCSSLFYEAFVITACMYNCEIV